MAKGGRRRRDKVEEPAASPPPAAPPEPAPGPSGNRLAFVAGGLLLLAAAGYFAFFNDPAPPPPATSSQTPTRLISGHEGFVDNATCAGCHADIAASYAETGMGRAFYAATPEAMAHLGSETAFEHDKTGRSYRIIERDGAFYMRRHETDENGSETNVFEKRIDYVMGSGNNARTYIHQYPNGKLVEMPVGWYSESGGFLEMSPGYDAERHDGFRREIPFDCIGCHNGFSAIEPGTDARSGDPLLPGALAQGIGCQRCHGPAEAHVEAVAAGSSADEIAASIFNPARASRDRQLETCMQCHLESTSRRLPYTVARFDRGAFSYRPGEPLEDFILHFDYPQGVHEDRFEIAHAAYRLRKSACFLRSEMTCTTCHDPHRAPRGEEARTQFADACQTCHGETALAAIPNHAAGSDCQSCHMPQRRADDVVHTVMTDHYIQRRPLGRDLLAPLEEIRETPSTAYRGPVEPYYPADLSRNPKDQLYLAVAQVTQQTNLEAGTRRLRELIEERQPEQADFYFQLAEAYWNQQNLDEALRWYQQAVERDPGHLIALRNYSTVLMQARRYPQAEDVVRQALELAPDDPKGLNNLGDILVTMGRAGAAVATLNRALEGDPDSPEALHNLARAHGVNGDRDDGIAAARRAIQVNPDFAAAYNVLGNLLVEDRELEQAERAFQKALELDADYASAHYNYASLLALQQRFTDAERHVRTAVRLEPTMAAAHGNLGNLLGMRGDAIGAERSLRRALELTPNQPGLHFNLGNALASQRRLEEAEQRFRRAIELRPGYSEARMNLAIILFTQGDEEAARAEAAQIADPALRDRAEHVINGEL